MILHQNVLGVDVAKDWIDICDLASGKTRRTDTSARALKAFAANLAKDSFVVFEASGGYERPLMAALRFLCSVTRERLTAPFARRLAGRFLEGAVEGAEGAEAEVEGDRGDGLARLSDVAEHRLCGFDAVGIDKGREVAVAEIVVDQPA